MVEGLLVVAEPRRRPRLLGKARSADPGSCDDARADAGNRSLSQAVAGPRLRYTTSMSEPAIDITALSPEERLELIGRLWDSLSDEDVPLSREERDLLDERLDRLERDGPSGVPWEDIAARWKRERSHR